MLDQRCETADRPLVARRAGKRSQRRPDRFLDVGGEGHAFLGKQHLHPLRRPGPLTGIIHPRQWLEGNLPIGIELVEAASHAEDRRHGRAAFVETKDECVLVAPELQVEQIEQNRFSGAGRPDDERVPDITLMEHQAEWRRAGGPGMQ